jgi:hypothetical protein
LQADFSVELGQEDPALELPWASGDPSVRYYDLKRCPELVLQIPEAVAHPELSAFLTRINAPDSPFATAKCDVWPSRDIFPEEEIFGAAEKFVSYVDLIFVDAKARISFQTHEAFAEKLCVLLGRVPDIPATVELVIRRCYYHQRADRHGEIEQDSTGSEKSRPVSLENRSVENFSLDAIPQGSFPQEGLPSDIMPSQSLPLKKALLERNPLKNPSQDHELKSLPLLSLAFQSLPSQSVPWDDSNETISGYCLTTYVTGFGDSNHESRRQWVIALALLQHAMQQASRQ